MSIESDPIPGLGLLDGLDLTRRQMHQGALDIVDQHRTEGRPFVLCLRTFRLGFFEASGYQRLLENRLRDSLWARGELRIVTVQMREASVHYESTKLARDPRRRWLPSLVVDDQDWLEAVKYLIQRAELIVSEMVTLRPGVMAELDACEQARRQDRTVVVLPPAESILSVDQDPIDARFPRTIESSELDSRDPLLTFVFRDLVARLERIDRVAVPTRLDLLRRGALDARFPIRYSGVERGYAELAARRRKSQAWTAAALAHAKAGQIAALTGRPGTAHLCESAEAWFWAKELDRAAIGARKVMELLKEGKAPIEGRESAWANATIILARALVAQGRRRAAGNLLREQIRRAKAARKLRAEAPLLVGMAELGPGREAKNACLRAIKLSRATRDLATETKAFNRLGMIYFQTGDLAAAANALEQALRRLARRGSINPHLRWSVLMNVGTVRIEQERPQAARSALRKAFAVARRSGDRAQLENTASALQYLGARIDLPAEDTDANLDRQGPAIVLFSPSVEPSPRS